jgi:hypothetical protein
MARVSWPSLASLKPVEWRTMCRMDWQAQLGRVAGASEGTHRQDRHRDRDQQPVRETDRERDHRLQLCHPVAIAGQVRDEPECESSRHDQEGFSGGLAPYSSERTLYLSRQWAGDRSECDRGGAEFDLTEFPGVWAYIPVF